MSLSPLPAWPGWCLIARHIAKRVMKCPALKQDLSSTAGRAGVGTVQLGPVCDFEASLLETFWHFYCLLSQ